MTKFEDDKFIVINTKYLTYSKIPRNVLGTWFFLLDQMNRYVPDNKYYVCNQDEPYAQDVLDIILSRKPAKTKTPNSDYSKCSEEIMEYIFKNIDGSWMQSAISDIVKKHFA